MWRSEQRENDKSTKVPYDAWRNRKASSSNRKTWTSIVGAMVNYQKGGFSGIGFVFTADDPYCGIDLDHCRDPQTGTIEPWAQEIIDKCGSYAEVSPSGTGVKIFGRGKLPSGGKRHGLGNDQRIELYDQRRYFAVTGHLLPGLPSELSDLQPVIDELWQKYFAKSAKKARENGRPKRSGQSKQSNALERCRHHVAQLQPAISGQGGHNRTFHAACECYRYGLSDAEAFSVLAEYNTYCKPPWDEAELRHKLTDARRQVETDGELGSRFRQEESSEQCGQTESNEEAEASQTWQALESRNSGSEDGGDNKDIIKQLADEICAKEHFAQDAGGKLYRFAHGVYSGGGEELIRRRVKSLLNEWTATEKWNRVLAENVVEYVRVDAPHLWERPPLDVLNVRNGLLDVATRKLRAHDPAHLSPVQLPVDYDPAAACPMIEKFVNEVFPLDAAALAWEIPAYLMLPDTSIQKAVLLLGPGGSRNFRIAQVENSLLVRSLRLRPAQAGSANELTRRTQSSTNPVGCRQGSREAPPGR